MWYTSYIFIIIFFVLILATLYILPNFYIKIIKSNVSRKLFNTILFIMLLIFQIWAYYERIFQYKYKNFKVLNSWMDLEFCTISCWTVMFLLIFPNKILMDCTLPLGIMGPVYSVFLGGFDYNSFLLPDYYRFYFSHITIIFAYLYLFNFGFTESKFGKELIYRSLIYTTITGMAVEIYNLAFDANNIYQKPTSIFLGDHQSEIINFLFVLSWLFPITLLISYLIIWYFKPVYSQKLHLRINDTWFEKLVKKYQDKNSFKNTCI